MHVVRHQAVGVQLTRIAGSGQPEGGEKALIIDLVEEDRLAVIPSGHQVIETSGGMEARVTRHPARLADWITLGKSDTLGDDVRSWPQWPRGCPWPRTPLSP